MATCVPCSTVITCKIFFSSSCQFLAQY
jgi:hypothetical protein